MSPAKAKRFWSSVVAVAAVGCAATVWAQTPTGLPPGHAPVPAKPAPRRPVKNDSPAPKASPSAQSPSAQSPSAQSPSAQASAASQGRLPAGHPPVQGPASKRKAGALPSGHPPPGSGRASAGGRFRPPQNRVQVDPQLPAGSVDIRIVDGMERPQANAAVTLHILRNTVEKGESRSKRELKTDATGRLRIAKLATGNSVSYSVATRREKATFRSSPFRLKKTAGVRVVLHAYEQETSLRDAAVVMEAFVILDVKQDTIAVNHLLRAFNFGRTAYVPTDLRMRLPKGATSFNTKEGAIGLSVRERDGFVELAGTMPPGQAEVTYRYSVDRGGESTRRLNLPLPPRVVRASVLVSAGKGMGLDVVGFSQAQVGRRRDGQRVLQAARQADLTSGVQALMSNTNAETLDVTIRGLPTPGPARWLALLAMISAVLAGFSSYWKKSRSHLASDDLRQELEEARDALLDELVVLEHAKNDGEVGPKSYQRLRLALLDALARIVARLDAAGTVDSEAEPEAS